MAQMYSFIPILDKSERSVDGTFALVEEGGDEREVVAGTGEVAVAAVRSSWTTPRGWALVHILLWGQGYAYRL